MVLTQVKVVSSLEIHALCGMQSEFLTCLMVSYKLHCGCFRHVASSPVLMASQYRLVSLSEQQLVGLRHDFLSFCTRVRMEDPSCLPTAHIRCWSRRESTTNWVHKMCFRVHRVANFRVSEQQCRMRSGFSLQGPHHLKWHEPSRETLRHFVSANVTCAFNAQESGLLQDERNSPSKSGPESPLDEWSLSLSLSRGLLAFAGDIVNICAVDEMATETALLRSTRPPPRSEVRGSFSSWSISVHRQFRFKEQQCCREISQTISSCRWSNYLSPWTPPGVSVETTTGVLKLEDMFPTSD